MYQHTHCELEQDYKISNILQFTVKYSTYNSILRYFSLHKELLLLSVDGFNSVCCLLSVLERCPSYREYSYSKKTEKCQGPTPGVGLREASVKTELTVQDYYKLYFCQAITELCVMGTWPSWFFPKSKILVPEDICSLHTRKFTFGYSINNLFCAWLCQDFSLKIYRHL